MEEKKPKPGPPPSASDKIKPPPPHDKDVPKNNRSLLWAIFSLLAVLIILAVVFIALGMRGDKDPESDPFAEGLLSEEKTESETDPFFKPPIDPVPENKPAVAPGENDESKPERCKADKFDGKKYDDGESYTTQDGCETCTCEDGHWDCKIKDSCIILPSDCTHSNHVYHDGEARSAECDQTCTCDNGNWNCVMAPGSSCCESGGNIYHNGESFPAGDGCNTCTCNNGSTNCTMMLCI